MNNNIIDHKDPAVFSYLEILQSIINRMASSSASCKTWSIALVSAIMVIVANKGNPDFVWIATIPIVLFFFLDSNYLGLERQFRRQYTTFVCELHKDKVSKEDIFLITTDTGMADRLYMTFRAFSSISTWPFYGLLLIMLIIIRLAIL